MLKRRPFLPWWLRTLVTTILDVTLAHYILFCVIIILTILSLLFAIKTTLNTCTIRTNPRTTNVSSIIICRFIPVSCVYSSIVSISMIVLSSSCIKRANNKINFDIDERQLCQIMCGDLDKRLALILNAKSIAVPMSTSMTTVVFCCCLLTAAVRSYVFVCLCMWFSVIKERENEN